MGHGGEEVDALLCKLLLLKAVPALLLVRCSCGSQGSLIHALKRGTFTGPDSKPNMEFVYMCLLEIALALRHLHTAKIAHCDLKVRSHPHFGRFVWSPGVCRAEGEGGGGVEVLGVRVPWPAIYGGRVERGPDVTSASYRLTNPSSVHVLLAARQRAAALQPARPS